MPSEVLCKMALRAIISTVLASAALGVHAVNDDFNVSQFSGLAQKLTDGSTFTRDIKDVDQLKRLWRFSPLFSRIYFPLISGFYKIPQFTQDVTFSNEPELETIKRDGAEDEKKRKEMPRRSKRLLVCPFAGRAGLPLGGCLYSYVRPRNRSSGRTSRRPAPVRAPRPVRRKIYRARWPEYYFLGGALGRR